MIIVAFFGLIFGAFVVLNLLSAIFSIGSAIMASKKNFAIIGLVLLAMVFFPLIVNTFFK